MARASGRLRRPWTSVTVRVTPPTRSVRARAGCRSHPLVLPLASRSWSVYRHGVDLPSGWLLLAALGNSCAKSPTETSCNPILHWRVGYHESMRAEQAVFDELASLCVSRGFLHAVATICLRDTVVGFAGDLSSEDLASMRARSRLIRTEITTLIGLAMREPIDFSLPAPGVLSDYIQRAEALLEELHQTMLPHPPGLADTSSAPPDPDSFTFGSFLRESIFYGGESAYPFQYRDLAPLKYDADSAWLSKNKSIDLAIGRSVCKGIADILNQRIHDTLRALRGRPQTEWTLLPGFAFSCEELASHIRERVDEVKAFIDAFTLPDSERNTTFTSLSAFNSAYAYPFIRKGSDEIILLQYYGVSEAFYEGPFYWMCKDESYVAEALRHRGDFAESFAAERLSLVFGSDRVFQNVEIRRDKAGTRAC